MEPAFNSCEGRICRDGGTEGVGTYVALIECRVWGRLEEAQGRQSKESPKWTDRKKTKRETGKSNTVIEDFTSLI